MRINAFLLLILGIIFGCGQVSAMPKMVMVIRHAEKPLNKEDIHLNEKGYARARALPAFFLGYDRADQIRLVAQGQKRPDSSLRPIETLIPASKEFQQTILNRFVKGESQLMVEHIKTASELNQKTVVISWGHDELGEISAMLGADQGEWSSAIFDRAWIFQYDSLGTLTRFENIPQRILPGDSDH